MLRQHVWLLAKLGFRLRSELLSTMPSRWSSGRCPSSLHFFSVQGKDEATCSWSLLVLVFLPTSCCKHSLRGFLLWLVAQAIRHSAITKMMAVRIIGHLFCGRQCVMIYKNQHWTRRLGLSPWDTWLSWRLCLWLLSLTFSVGPEQGKDQDGWWKSSAPPPWLFAHSLTSGACSASCWLAGAQYRESYMEPHGRYWQQLWGVR